MIASPPAVPLRNRAMLLQWLTVIHGVVEGVASLFAASLAGSVALLSFGLDSAVEVLSASIVLWRIWSAGRSRGWTLSERSGLRLVGVCFLLLAVAVGSDAIHAIVGQEKPHETMLGILVAVFSVLAMPLLARAKRKISGEMDSHAMRADARQTDFCAYLAGILLVGLVAYRTLGWWWADPAAALLMTPIILWEGIQALRGFSCGCAVHH